MNETHTGYVSNRVLKFQVGFLLSEGRGHSSDSELDIPRVRIAEDLILDHLYGALRFSRTSRGILVQGQLRTRVLAECNRCLEKTQIQVEVNLEEIFVYPPESGAEFTVDETGVLNLAPLLREEIIVETPISVLCRPDCAGLCPECGYNLNAGPCDCDRRAGDPRFAILQTLKDLLSEE